MESTTRSSMATIPLLLLSIVFPASEVAGEPPSVVPWACKSASGVAGGSFTEDFCLSALTGHSPGAADYGDLALFAVDLATANATATEGKIDALLAGADGGGAALLAEGLLSCRELYDAVVRLYQPECRAAMRERRYVDGKPCLARTAQAAVDCDRWFQQRNVPSPVAQDDDNLAKLADLAIALASI